LAGICSSQNPDSHLSVFSIFRSANFQGQHAIAGALLSIRRKRKVEIVFAGPRPPALTQIKAAFRALD